MSSVPLLFDLSGRGHVVLSGKDRVAYLHGLVTNDIKKLAPGQGCHAGLLTPKGKLLVDLTALALADSIVLDTEPGLVEKLEGLLRKYLIFQEVEIANRTAETAVLHVAGEGALDTLTRLGLADPPDAPHAHAVLTGGLGPVHVVHEARTGSSGYDLRLPLAEAPGLVAALALEPSAPALLERLRILAGLPRWGAELSEDVLPNEARFERDAISYNKGCYIGQETTARIKTYGHVNRLLCHVVFPSDSRVEPGAELFAGDQKAGAVTSVTTADDGRVVTLAFVKRDHAAPGTPLHAGELAGTVADLPSPPLAF